MSRDYTEELVYTESEDGLALEGALIRPAAGPGKRVPVVWNHGLTGRFYSPTTIEIGRELARRGYTFVTGNSRGHDFGAILRTRELEPVLGGGAWERFDESPRDVGAWIGFAIGLGFPGVALLGHSLGSLKVAYYQARRQDPRVFGLIAASPPLRAGRDIPELRAQSERLVAEGRGHELLPWVDGPRVNFNRSAQTYLNRMQTNVDVYGWETPNPAVSTIRCPIFAFYGTNEEWVGTASDLEIIRRNATAAPRVDTRMFERADHSYNGHTSEVGAAIAEWVDTL